MKKGQKHSMESRKKIKEKRALQNNVKGYEKGHEPWNKGIKGIHLCPKTQFKKGQGLDKSASWKGGVYAPKNDCVHLTLKSKEKTRRPRYVYEQKYGKIPKGYVIFHKDGNKYNDAIENLTAITREELMKKNIIKRVKNEK